MGVPQESSPDAVSAAMTRLKKVVYKNRIRLKEFLIDFDKLRSGSMHVNHFLSGLSMAGMDKYLTAKELQAIADAYTVPRTSSLVVVDYRSFINEVDSIFTLPELEKNPLIEVPAEPSALLDKTRYLRSSRQLEPRKEEALQSVLQKIASTCDKRGMLVKPFFDDAAQDDHSAKLFGHVTIPQFKQCLNVKLGLQLSEAEVSLLVEKYTHEDFSELVNYVAFSNTVAPSWLLEAV